MCLGYIMLVGLVDLCMCTCTGQPCNASEPGLHLPDEGWSVVCAAIVVSGKTLRDKLATAHARLKEIFGDIAGLSCAMRRAYYMQRQWSDGSYDSCPRCQLTIGGHSCKEQLVQICCSQGIK